VHIAEKSGAIGFDRIPAQGKPLLLRVCDTPYLLSLMSVISVYVGAGRATARRGTRIIAAIIM
jgi:hypothetical protein